MGARTTNEQSKNMKRSISAVLGESLNTDEKGELFDEKHVPKEFYPDPKAHMYQTSFSTPGNVDFCGYPPPLP